MLHTGKPFSSRIRCALRRAQSRLTNAIFVCVILAGSSLCRTQSPHTIVWTRSTLVRLQLSLMLQQFFMALGRAMCFAVASKGSCASLSSCPAPSSCPSRAASTGATRGVDGRSGPCMHDGDGWGAVRGLGGAPISAPQAKKFFWPECRFP